jgi:hypothetical protein
MRREKMLQLFNFFLKKKIKKKKKKKKQKEFHVGFLATNFWPTKTLEAHHHYHLRQCKLKPDHVM